MTSTSGSLTLMRSYRTLFWDFDGVIKESVTVKSDAFERLFAPFGVQIAARVRDHHECHGGMSRYEKLPLYLQWAGCGTSVDQVSHYCELFSAAVRAAVVKCAWVPGVREYLEANYKRQIFFVVTATPQGEIDDILCTLGIAHWFRGTYGAPISKPDAILSALRQLKSGCTEALLIGDSETDYVAATATGVDFLLRRTSLNRALQQQYLGPQCIDFAHA